MISNAEKCIVHLVNVEVQFMFSDSYIEVAGGLFAVVGLCNVTSITVDVDFKLSRMKYIAAAGISGSSYQI